MNPQSLLQELAELSRIKGNWYSVASTFEKFKQHYSKAGYAHPHRRIRDACKACGYSLNTVNRMMAVREFFDSVKGSVKDLAGVDPDTLSFPSLEVIKRLHQVNPNEGVKMLAEVAGGKLTYRNLREHYKQVFSKNASAASGQQLAKKERGEFEEAAFRGLLYAQPSMFVDKIKRSIEKVKPMQFPLSVDAIAFGWDPETKKSEDVGFMFFHLRSNENFKQRIEPLLSRLLFNACFFKAIWVIFPSNIGSERIRIFSEILHLLDRHSVGIAILPWEKERGRTEDHILEFVRVPRSGPSPDWRDKLDNFGSLYFPLTQPSLPEDA
ncbi:hypothetical protein SAMN05660860_00128 [Geoalkalibacter ferrihydriticus]|uniref:Uncharacterized protein n=2 Tax=Geoalkalibacter ferrihydriticus TaxID=392333 RepID=A0A0C2HMT3_9BACT|nr:hypothetical protein [Geoalkalibacter ferrihydriticus]KIH76255.1 hypothetical protein GFER_11595 [Geoalkalibacter ferrihydriticus DSM 17813]SDL24204.1 hypothetical protein SAMN05660860_00128 [Geoalkalibacter ferrihydriticus]